MHGSYEALPGLFEASSWNSGPIHAPLASIPTYGNPEIVTNRIPRTRGCAGCVPSLWQRAPGPTVGRVLRGRGNAAASNERGLVGAIPGGTPRVRERESRRMPGTANDGLWAQVFRSLVCVSKHGGLAVDRAANAINLAPAGGGGGGRRFSGGAARARDGDAILSLRFVSVFISNSRFWHVVRRETFDLPHGHAARTGSRQNLDDGNAPRNPLICWNWRFRRRFDALFRVFHNFRLKCLFSVEKSQFSEHVARSTKRWVHP